MGIFGKGSAAFQLAFLEIIALLIIINIVVITNSIHQNQVLLENEEYVEERLSYNISLYDDWVERLSKVIESVAYNPQVQKLLAENDILKRIKMDKDIQRYLVGINILRDEISNINLINKNGTIFSYSGVSTIGRAELQNVVKEAGIYKKPIFTFYENLLSNRSNTRFSIIVIFPVYSLYEEYAPLFSYLGTVVFQIDNEVFCKLIGLNMTSQEEVEEYILDESENIIMSIPKNANLLDRRTKDSINDASDDTVLRKSNYFIASRKLNNIELKLVRIENKVQMSEDFRKIYLFEIALLSGVCLVLILTFVVVTKGVIFPLKNLVHHIERLRSQYQEQQAVKLKGSFEIQQLGTQFNSLMFEKQELMEDLLGAQNHLYRIELNQKQMELEILKSQINPHFLTNSLEVIQGMALKDGHKILAESIKHLSAIFRYSIRAPEYVELYQEIDLIKSYLAIQQLRFGNKCSWDIEVDAEAQYEKVPKMILQPIVENAVHHGISIKKDGGYINIIAKIEKGDLVIQISDNGIGIQPDILSGIKSNLTHSKDYKLSHSSWYKSIGLRNVQERIWLLYGDGYGLTIDSTEGIGTTITISLPIGGDQDV